MALLLHVGEFEILELLVRVEQRPGNMRQDQHALSADENGAGTRQLVSFKQGLDGRRRSLRSVVPSHRERFVRGISSPGKDVLDLRVKSPVPLVRGQAFGANGQRCRQFKGAEYGIEDVASHVAE